MSSPQVQSKRPLAISLEEDIRQRGVEVLWGELTDFFKRESEERRDCLVKDSGRGGHFLFTPDRKGFYDVDQTLARLSFLISYGIPKCWH